MAETFFSDNKSKTEIMSALADVQLDANIVAWRVSVLSADAFGQLERANGCANGLERRSPGGCVHSDGF